jgi:mannose-6-phosphate isomerase
MKPITLQANQPKRFYRGGAAIAEFRGNTQEGDHTPEDWIGSTTSFFGESSVGQTRLEDGRFLRAHIEAAPEAYLGPRHVERFGANLEILVKLLDAGQRLPVHAHPDRDWARRELGTDYGKTEAWIILSVSGTAATVHVGFREEMDPVRLRRLVAANDSATLLGALNTLQVKPGDSIFVPGGVPHAINEGVFMLELQEPSDLSVLMEWEGLDLDGAADGHLKLGFDKALECVDLSAWNEDRLKTIWRKREYGRSQIATHGARPGPSVLRVPVSSLLPPSADAFFRAELVDAEFGVELEPGFAILVVARGQGTLRSESGGVQTIARGETLLVPFGSGVTRIKGDMQLIRCSPPNPDR